MLKQGSLVFINCPSERAYPSFHKAFHGRRGRVVGDVTAQGGMIVEWLSQPHVEKACSALLRVDVSGPADKEKIVITVLRRWLRAC